MVRLPVKPTRCKFRKTYTLGFILCTTAVIISWTPFLYMAIFRRTSLMPRLREPEPAPEGNYVPPTDNDNDDSVLVVNSSKCKIARTKIMPEFWVKNWKTIRRPICIGRQTYGRLTDQDVFLLDEEYRNASCYLTPVVRPTNNDNKVWLLNSRRLEMVTNVSDIEMFSIYCEGGDHPNFEATVAISKPVQEKIDFWETRKANGSNEVGPISVLYFGIDSTSRSHFHRSFKKTSKLFEKLGFWDFKAHHATAAYTIRNMFAMLAGYSMQNMTKAMRRWREKYYDEGSCPWIWKEFSRRKYVTFNLQDRQTFNVDPSLKGFKSQPSDFYLRPLLLYMENYWDNWRKNGSHANFDDCLSPQTSSASFIIRFKERLLKRIGNEAPFFGFTFLTYPFHDFQLSHQNFDDELYSFFTFMSTSGLLGNTMVIFGGDHGDRVEFFGTDYVEGFLERSLPSLFIHFPDMIFKKNPQFREALMHNTQALTTHFDVHHTMLHLLALSDPTLKSKFIPSLSDRSSLFLSITQPRDCYDLQIEPGMCLCNVALSPDSVKDKYFLHRLYVFAVSQLNSVLRNSSYGSFCGRWKVLLKPEVEAHIVQPRTRQTVNVGTRDSSMTVQYMLFFTTVPFARFQVLIEVHAQDSKLVSLKVAGKFERKGSYGNSSSCIVPKTLSDRKFKELCFCKQEGLTDEENYSS